MVEAAPSPSFKMSQPDLLLEVLIVAFDPPSQLGNLDELTERDVFRKRRQPIFDRFLLAFGPFNQQPLLRPTVGEPVIPMRDTNAHTGNREDNFSPVASRHVIVRQARFGRANASSLTEAGLCLSSRRSSFGGRPRPDHFFGGRGPVPGAHTVVCDWMPAT